jgi:hypothetical protein
MNMNEPIDLNKCADLILDKVVERGTLNLVVSTETRLLAMKVIRSRVAFGHGRRGMVVHHGVNVTVCFGEGACQLYAEKPVIVTDTFEDGPVVNGFAQTVHSTRYEHAKDWDGFNPTSL